MARRNYQSDLPIYEYYQTSRTSQPSSDITTVRDSLSIFNAIIQNDIGLLRAIIEESDFDLNTLRDGSGKTPLMVAAFSNRPTVVRYLLSFETVDVDLEDMAGESALYQAASAGNVEVVEILIGSGAFVELEDEEGTTPLIVAASKGYAGVCRVLLDHGRANVNYQDRSQRTALALAAYGGHYAVVELLLSRGADVHVIDQDGWSVLMLAAYGGWPDICRLMLDNNADRSVVANNGRTAETAALESGRKAAASLIANYVPAESQPPQSPCSPAVPLSPHSAFRPSLSATPIRSPPFNRQQFLSSNLQEITMQKTKNNTSKTPSNIIIPPITTKTRRVALQPRDKNRRAERHKAKLEQQSNVWAMFSLVSTSCFCNICLSSIGKMRNAKVRQAWREKLALCFVILFISMISAFLSFGLSTVACQDKQALNQAEVLRLFGPNASGPKAHVVRGQLYNTENFFTSGSHRPIAPFTDSDLNLTISQLFGQDISGFFPPDYQSIGCASAPKDNGPLCSQAIATGDRKLHCHVSDASRDALNNLRMNLFVGFSWDDIKRGDRNLLVNNGAVYDLGQYLDPSNSDFWLGNDAITAWIKTLVGRDATRDIIRAENTTNIAKCFEHFKVGLINDGTGAGCFVASAILRAVTFIFIGATATKFLFAMTFDWYLAERMFKKPKMTDAISHLIYFVTCYSEGEESIRCTLDSLACTTYSNQHKLLFVVADGDITGSDNERSTPQICKDLLEPQFPDAPEPMPLSYTATGDEAKRHNMAQVYTGYYTAAGNRVPMVLIIKCGTPEERQGPKAGNRGKRDSQLILMKWLRHIFFNDNMCPLEFELFEKVHRLTGITPDKYEMVLMVDADTVVKPDSTTYLVDAMERDPKLIGLSGETKVANKTESWVTIIQVFEYYLSHHLGKSFESVFGGVTCLPGCFCMYRIKVPKYEGYYLPILASPEIVDAYASNDVESLHRKNLLILGEDRFLTSLMLKIFPRRKLAYIPKAVCKTVVPDNFKVLLSQRRRWINSTVHTLMELVMYPYLCGFCCFSMQFVLLLELIGSAVTPFSVLVALYLIIGFALGLDVAFQIIFVAAVLFLPSLLLVISSRKAVNLLWMLAYIFSFPIWNFVLPVYAYWRFDDFSWGATRKISGTDNGHGGENIEKTELKPIPTKKWHEWKMQEETRKLLKYYSGFVSPNATSPTSPNVTSPSVPPSAPLPGIASSNTLRRVSGNDNRRPKGPRSSVS